jgi:drug/metabolite transporter (DMT)-like permease
MYFTSTPHFPLGPPAVRPLLIFRGLGGFFGVSGLYFSLLYLPLSDAIVLTFLAPAVSCWACSILINEPFTRREQLAGLVSLVGVVLIARPTSLFASDNARTVVHGAAEAAPTISASNLTSLGNATHVIWTTAEEPSPTLRLAGVGLAMIGVFGAAVSISSPHSFFFIFTIFFLITLTLVCLHFHSLDRPAGTPAHQRKLFLSLVYSGLISGTRANTVGSFCIASERTAVATTPFPRRVRLCNAVPAHGRSGVREELSCDKHDVHTDAICTRLRSLDLGN